MTNGREDKLSIESYFRSHGIKMRAAKSVLPFRRCPTHRRLIGCRVQTLTSDVRVLKRTYFRNKLKYCNVNFATVLKFFGFLISSLDQVLYIQSPRLGYLGFSLRLYHIKHAIRLLLLVPY